MIYQIQPFKDLFVEQEILKFSIFTSTFFLLELLFIYRDIILSHCFLKDQ